MSTVPSLQDPDDLEVRSGVHYQMACELRRGGHEWAAVPMFYTAYSLVRAAILRDPVFDTVQTARAKNEALTITSKYSEHHKGSAKSSRGLGVSQMVLILYPTIAARYERLYTAGVQVRYGKGINPIGLDSLDRDLEVVRTEYANGCLVTS